MRSTILSRPVFRLAATLALVAVAACNDSTSPDEEHADEVASIRLVVTQGATSSTFTVGANGAVTPSPLRVPVGTSTITATPLDAAGTAIPSAELADFRIEVPSTTGFTFTRTAAFTGTMTVTATVGAVVPVALCLFHVEENHCDLGPWPNFSVTIGG